MDDYTFEFFSRWKLYKPAIFIADPYDTHTKWNNSSISKEYAKFGITLLTPKVILGENGNVAEQIRVTQTNLNRLQVADHCTDFISAIQNARYPERKEGSQSTSTNFSPIHNWTSHFRTSLEYLMLFLTEQEEFTPKKKELKRYEI